jgi:hypothetical protein
VRCDKHCCCQRCVQRIPEDEDAVPFHRRVGALEAIAALRRGDMFVRRRIVGARATSN